MDWKEKADKVLEKVCEGINIKGFEDGFQNSTVDHGNYLEDTYGFFDEKGNKIIVTVTIQEDDLMEEETMKKNYTTLREDFGSMPLAGYISELNQKICRLDGFDVLAFLNKLYDVASELSKRSEQNEWTEQEAFIILSHDFDLTMELQFEILFDLNNSEEEYYEDAPKYYYRIYTKSQEWGLDEIEPLKEKKYSVVAVKMSRIRKVEEVKTIYIAVSDDFADEDIESEVEHYIQNSYCQDDSDWEENDDFFNEEGWGDTVVIQGTTVVRENYNPDDYDYELEDTLE